LTPGAQAIVLDSDFLSAFLKIERLPLVRDFFGADVLFVPPAVYREISLTDLLSRLIAISWIQVQTPDHARGQSLGQNEAFARLGPGEQEAIALCLEISGSVLLTNDNRARQAATDLGVKVFNVPTFLLACKMSGLTNREQMTELVKGLEERDRYGFRKDVRELLLA
jgi:predicted nucleic acid-binding protein